MRSPMVRSSLVALCMGALLSAPCAATQTLRRSGVVTDSQGEPLTGNYLLDFRMFDSVDGRELWKESIYVRADQGVFRAELGRSSPLPTRAGLSEKMVVMSAPAGTGWTVRDLPPPPPTQVMPVEEAAPAKAAPSPTQAAPVAMPVSPAPAPPPAIVPAPKPAPQEQQAIRRLEEQLQKVEAELKAQKSSTRPGIYEVQPGDTLRSISQKLFGNPERWVDIYQANDDRLLRGGGVVTGQKLIIPRDVPGVRK